MKPINFVLKFCIVILLFSSCKKHTDTPTPQPTPPIFTGPNVYVVGSYTASGGSGAVLWTNGSPTWLNSPATNGSAATGIAVVGKDVYISGYAMVNNVSKAVYWKNNVVTVLGNGRATGIAVLGTDVYVCGSTITSVGGNNYYLATYWKNSVAVPLKIQSNYLMYFDSFANAIAVDAGNVYVAGYFSMLQGGGAPVVVSWKNGNSTILTTTGSGALNSFSNATSVVLQNNDVYIAGYISTSDNFPVPVSGAVYWKNGTPVSLVNADIGSISNYIAVQGSDIYVAGKAYLNNSGTFNVYWKNNSYIKLNDINLPSGYYGYQYRAVSNITTYKNDVYVCGYVNTSTTSYAAYWKNDQVVSLGVNGSTTAIAVVDL